MGAKKAIELSPAARELQRAYMKAYTQRPEAKEAHRRAQARYWERKAARLAEQQAANPEEAAPTLFTTFTATPAQPLGDEVKYITY